MRLPFRGNAPRTPWQDTNPIREELFSAERLEAHARSLAATQTATIRGSAGRSLARRLTDNEAVLLGAYRHTVSAVEAGGAITPAAEWLVDNYHLVEKHIRNIQVDLPPGYYNQLPKLAAGPFAAYPAILGIAWALVAHSDSRFDAEALRRFVRAYQEVQPLTIGELWALSITLRIVLIENLRRLAEQTLSSRTSRQRADLLADRLLGAGAQPAVPVRQAVVGLADGPLAEAFAVQLVHRLRDQDQSVVPALSWLERRLAAQGTNAETVVANEHRRQGASNVTVRNIITSLRMISDVDWDVLFEQMSLVDERLAAASDFRSMDFPTRNLYRSAIEDLARHCGRSETDIVALAVARGQRPAPPGDDGRWPDPGTHLIGTSRLDFERELGYRAPWRTWPMRLNLALGIGLYLGTVGAVGALVLSIPMVLLDRLDVGAGALLLLAVCGLMSAADLAVGLVNRAVTCGFRAAALPGLDLRDGVPASLRTLVAVPMLLTGEVAIAEQIERLEVHHLASPEGCLHFALLSDWTDARTAETEGDQALLALATAGIARLNAHYGPAPGGVRFLLLHRPREWGATEARWMGWERKRGKLHALNRALRGATDSGFLDTHAIPTGVRFVVTLDSDTRLPRDTIRRLIGKMAHPLNRPSVDPGTGRVVAGHGVLQPRVTPSLPMGHGGSHYQRIFSSPGGIDPYAAAVSDVYQDLFNEGSYAGKGIYDVDAFEFALAGRVPDGTMLSHDLFEGIFARAALASDIEVVEDFPSRYDVGAMRHHRWARGDWQLLPWIFGNGPSMEGASAQQRAIPAIGRWKMLDNLRRSLTAPAAVLALTVGFTLPLAAALVWTGFLLATILLPVLLPVVAGAIPRRPDVTVTSHLRALATDLRRAAVQIALAIAFLADQAWLMGDAIGRTLWRLFVSGRHLLEWVTAAQATDGDRLTISGFAARMAGGVALGFAALGLSALAGAGAWPLAAVFTVVWCAAPALAWWISLRRPAEVRAPATRAQVRSLRQTARLTWRFFERFVTAADNMLPPDNFQEDPSPVLAHRTSPTNIGLYLLSVVSARDFGWIGTAEMVERLEATLGTMARMQRFRGHFYNWYDTSDLRPLDPRYVSSVDSGNLAGHLIALSNAAHDWRVSPPAAPDRSGITDAVGLSRAALVLLDDRQGPPSHSFEALDSALAGLADAADGDTATLLAQAEAAHRLAQTLAEGRPGDLLYWTGAILRSLASHRDDALPRLAERLGWIEDTAAGMAMAMEFGFLLDPARKLLSIGYLVPEGTLDPSCYDLLASEARLASFVAIAKGDVPARHWFRLGRAATRAGTGAALISWSGSMFEYLMPALVMRAPAGSLLEHTSRLIVERQITYATDKRRPWGISESAYNARDLEFTYQYSNFGLPGLGLKRGLGENFVVAPYATALAAMVDPRAAVENLDRLVRSGARGAYGFYEALDFTPTRVPLGAEAAVVRAFMAHHQGMTIVAIANAVLGGVMRARFHGEPMVQATELLLQERVPRDIATTHSWAAEVKSTARERDLQPSAGRHFSTAQQASPATLLLSNGRFTTMLTSAGSGYSRWGELAITRWREDVTCDDSGSYILLRDVQSGTVWSAGFQPTGVAPGACQIVFQENRAEFIRTDATLVTGMEIIVSGEDDAEVRRVSLTNTGRMSRIIEVTSYIELVLAPQSADIAHPAFSKLFVETEHVPGIEALLATRRRRAPTEPEIWAAHFCTLDELSKATAAPPQVETDRARFLGRGNQLRQAAAMQSDTPLSGTVGNVLDPIFALRRRVTVAPGATVRLNYWTMVAQSRDAVLASVDRHADPIAFTRAATLAWTQAQVQFYHLATTASEAGLFQRLAGHVIYASPRLRPPSARIAAGAGSQSGLWAQGISGDLPIVLLRIDDIEHLGVVRTVLKAHEYWGMKRLAVDLVILNDRQSSYAQDLQIALETLLRTSRSRREAGHDGRPGRVVVLRADLIPADTRTLLEAAARVVLLARRGSLAAQLDRLADALPEPLRPVPPRLPRAGAATPAALPALEFFNGLGGFDQDGAEYVIRLGPGQATPAPWIHVVANPAFGFQASAEGSGYTWAVNSRENQLIPRLFDQNLCAHSRMPMDMTRHGWASSLFHVSQQ